MARLVQKTQNRAKSPFDPSKPYSWDPSDIFEITGQQLAILYHMLVREVNDPQGAPIIMKYEAYRLIMSLMEMGVEQGVIKETELENAVSKEEYESQVKEMFDRDPVPQVEKERT